ncbi:apolipoprotein N-acyltransferase [Andreprevotia chitinilytica]|uniref:apolipoprotein N-acyltransferase n=1 Tax=Andreprevotia chitinilytica TaxID=396808 RepID=UPI00068B8597|nr:apolipoprotein N-acyltransferase [Andreprevotia chitinilytica]
MIRRLASTVLLAACGAASVFSFAPLNLAPLLLVSLAALFIAIAKAPTAKSAFVRAWVWGLGYFTANVHWIFISLYTYGGMPAWMAAGCVLLFAAYLALFPALAGGLAVRLRAGGAQIPASPSSIWFAVTLPSLFIAAEWLRGWLFTGFPWSAIGNNQVSTLAGFFPLIGVYGVGWLLALATAQWLVHWRRGLIATVALLAVSFGLAQIQWTKPIGAPLAVSIGQSAIRQSEKWDAAYYSASLSANAILVSEAKGKLILLPETVIPSFLADTPPAYIERLQQTARSKNADLLLGFAIEGERSGEYYNSVINIARPDVRYAKSHLVPFGEFVPLPWLFGWMYHYLNMPMSGFTSGGSSQPPLMAGNVPVAANICYEDAFGDELRRNTSNATLMANFSNMAWFDGSWAAEQHGQMSAARALENGRWMLRATNTGLTAVIDPQGRRVAALPERMRGVLEAQVQPMTGLTPYMRWGDWAIGLVLLVAIGTCVIRRLLDSRRP